MTACGTVGRATPRVCRAPGDAAGFSLLELLIVLMLMAIIAAVTLPIFGPGVSTTDLKRAAREVAAGKLDTLAENALKAHASGTTTKL